MISTTAIASAFASPKAFPGSSRSCPPPLNAHQRGPHLHTASSHGHFAHGVVFVDHVVKASVSSRRFDASHLTSSLNLAGRFGVPSFSRIQIGSCVSSPAQSRSGALVPSLWASRTHLLQRRCSTTFAAQSCTNQGLRKLASGRVHFHRRLSNSTNSIAPRSNRWMPKKCHCVTRGGQ